MSVLWVILNDDKSAVVEVFETQEPDAAKYQDKFMQHKQGNVFCRRQESAWKADRYKWYVNYFYWEEQARWGYGEPKGIAWSACLAIPESIKMLEIFAE